MIEAVFFMAVLLVFWNVNRIIFKESTNYANIFMVIWCVITSMSALGFYDFYKPPFEAYVYIFFTLVVFELMTLVCFFLKLTTLRKGYRVCNDIKWDLMTMLSLLCSVGMVPYVVKSIKYAMERGFYYLRLAVLNNELFSAMERTIVQDIIQPIIIVTTMISIWELVNNRKFRSITLISLINCALYMLTLGNRWLLMEVLYIAVVVVIGKYSLNIIRIIKQNKILIGIGVILIIGMAFITMQRSIKGSEGLFYDIYSYYVGSIHLFGVAISNPNTFMLNEEGLLWGGELFNSVTTFINYFAMVLGQPAFFKTGVEIVNEIMQEFYYVSPTTHMNNNVTMIYAFLRDFGVFGILIDTSVLAWFYMWLYKKRKQSIYNELMYLFSITLIPSLIFEWIYARVYVLMVFIVLQLLKMWNGKKIKIKF